MQADDATQQSRARRGRASTRTRASGALWRCGATALFAVVLLGATPKVREFDIKIQGRHVQGGASTIRVTRGDVVLMRWRTDEQVSVHVHGYDIQAKLAPAAPTVIRFEASVAGRFPIEAHQFGAAADNDSIPKRQHEVTLLYLEVLPE